MPLRLSRYIILFLILTAYELCSAQDIYLNPADREINDFVDELACAHIVQLNSVIKPYSRKLIGELLSEAGRQKEKLSHRQQQELIFYLKEYRPELINAGTLHSHGKSGQGSFSALTDPLSLCFSYHGADTLGTTARHTAYISLRPILSEHFYSNENGTANKTEIGAGIFGYAGRHLAFAAAIKKGFQTERLADPVIYTTEPGMNWKSTSLNGGEYHEWTGQLVYSWKWGSAAIIKDRFEWGNNYHGANIFSGKAPSFPYLQLHVKPAKWIEFTYINAILYSGVTDSVRTFIEHDGSKQYSIRKYMTANLLTVTPWKRLNISIGNSVIYSDKLQWSYVIPVLFYKSIDHTLYPIASSQGLVGDNAQMFLDISSRQIRHLHLYMTLFIDELMVSRITDPNLHNFFGWKAGFKLSDFPVHNLSFVAELTRTLPGTYQHPIATTTFESDGYNMGNYLRDNAQEIYLCLGYKPVRGLSVLATWRSAERGDEFIYGEGANIAGSPILKNIVWSDHSISLSAAYAITTNASVFLDYEYSRKQGDVKYNPQVFHGTTNTISCGFNVGF